VYLKLLATALLLCPGLLEFTTHVSAEDPVRARRGLEAPRHKTLSPDGKSYAVWYQDGWDEVIAIHDSDSGKEKRRIIGHGDLVQEFRFTPDGKVLASRSRDGWKLWEVATGKKLLELPHGKSK
jgi:WD40 repeat protein